MAGVGGLKLAECIQNCNLMKINLFVSAINRHYGIFEDLIRTISLGFTDLGIDTVSGINEFRRNAINIICGSVPFAIKQQRLDSLLDGQKYILYNMEQLDRNVGHLRNFPEYELLLRGAFCIWDYSPNNICWLQQNRFQNVFYVPPGFHKSMSTVAPTRKDIDILFYGGHCPRRSQLLHGMKDSGLNVVWRTATYGLERNHLIARSRINLNIHTWSESNILESVRCSFLVNNKAFVVSELSDHNPYGEGCVFVPYEKMLETCHAFIKSPQYLLDTFAERAYNEFSEKLGITKILKLTLEEMGSSLLEQLQLGATKSFSVAL